MRKRLGLVALAVTIITAGCITMVLAAEPGTDGDPLITKSYIDQVLLPQVYSYIDKAVAGISGTGQTGNATAASFEVISIKAGQKLEGKKGCEMVLRMGSATIIGSDRGGLADVTGGADLSSNAAMPANHLLIVPLDDGRGVKADTDLLVMVRGGYKIVE